MNARFLIFPDSEETQNLLVQATAYDLRRMHYGYQNRAPLSNADQIDEYFLGYYSQAKPYEINVNPVDFIITKDTLKELNREAFYKIFGEDQTSKDLFEKLWNVTKVDKRIKPIFGGVANGSTDAEPIFDFSKEDMYVAEKLHGIRVNRMDLSLMVPSIMHEDGHAIDYILPNKSTFKSEFMSEFVSIVLERVSAIITATSLNDKRIQEYTEKARTNGTIEAAKSVIPLTEHIKDVHALQQMDPTLSRIGENDHLILRSRIMQCLSFLHSDIYACEVTQKYLDDPKTFTQKMREMRDGKLKAEECLKYYGIRPDSQQIRDNIKSRLILPDDLEI